MNGLALCAGAAGLELGLHIAEPGYSTVCFVERQAEAAARLVARMEEEGAFAPAPVWDDVATFDGRPFRGVVDIVSAGYPCQPFSLAGKRCGARDPRHLWPHIRRIVAQVEPGWIFLENVANHLGLGFASVERDLRRLGYGVAAGLFSAFEAGASHERKRLFVLAHAAAGQLPQPQRRSPARARSRPDGADLADADGGGCGQAERGSASRGEPDRAGPRLADAAGLFRRAVERRAGDGVLPQMGERPGGAEMPMPYFAPGPAEHRAWLRILRDDAGLAPAIERRVRGAPDGMAHRMERLHLIGNGVCPLAAALAYATLRASIDRPGQDA
ncbi:MAG: DNA cytosine methyltransferase [Rhodospirillales bacterium]|nr:DNA cytosine methyltransferase [Rhodospirillales bacterium]